MRTWPFHDADRLPRKPVHNIAWAFSQPLAVPFLTSVPSGHVSLLVKLYGMFLSLRIGRVSYKRDTFIYLYNRRV